MKTKTRRFVKLTIGAELRTQLVTAIKVRRGPANDNKDFEPVVRRAHAVKRIKVGIGDKGYDAEKNHELLREELHAQSIIPARHEGIPVWRTSGRYRKEMKRGYSKKTYHQRSKDETIFSVVKRTMGDEVRSIRVNGQNNEMRMKIISYNAARIASLACSSLRGFLQSPGRSRFLYLLGKHIGIVREVTYQGRILLEMCSNLRAPLRAQLHLRQTDQIKGQSRRGILRLVNDAPSPR